MDTWRTRRQSFVAAIATTALAVYYSIEPYVPKVLLPSRPPFEVPWEESGTPTWHAPSNEPDTTPRIAVIGAGVAGSSTSTLR